MWPHWMIPVKRSGVPLCRTSAFHRNSACRMAGCFFDIAVWDRRYQPAIPYNFLFRLILGPISFPLDPLFFMKYGVH